jgi:predicted dehydrogenase
VYYRLLIDEREGPMSSASETVRLASIGLGWWGDMLATAAKGSAEIAACYSPSGERRSQFAAKHNCDDVGTIDDILGDAAIDGVVIATPHGVRLEVIAAAAAAGKHMFVEKPLALTADEARACARAAADAGVLLQVGHNKRRQSGYRELKRMIDSGEVGQVQLIEANISAPLAFNPHLPEWRKDIDHLPVGGMTPLGVHMVDTIHYLGGQLTSAMCMSRPVLGALDVDEVTTALFGMESGASAYLATLLSAGPVNTLRVLGTDRIAWTDQDGAKLFSHARGQTEVVEHEVQPIDTLADEMAEFASCIRSGGRPETGPAEAIAVVEVLDAMVASASSGTLTRIR